MNFMKKLRNNYQILKNYKKQSIMKIILNKKELVIQLSKDDKHLYTVNNHPTMTIHILQTTKNKLL